MKTLLTRWALGLLVASLTLAAGCKGGEKGSADASKKDAGSAAAPAPLPPAAGENGSQPGNPAGAASPGAQPARPGANAPGVGAQAGVPLIPSGPPDQVVAKVNGESITRGELDFMIKNVVNEGANVPAEKHAELRRNVLDDLINRSLVYQKAQTSNVTVTPAEMSESLAKIKADYPDEKSFSTEMSKQGMTVPGIESMVRRAMVIDKFIKSTIVTNVKVSSEEESKFYSENKEKMKHPEQVRASHIMIRVAQDATPEQKKAAKARAEEALARARKGEEFAGLAKQYSQDPGSVPRGGDLGYFGKGQMAPAFDAAAFGLKIGELSGVVETPFGYHVIKVTEHRPEGYVPITDVRIRIKEYLTNQKVQEQLHKLTESLRTQAKIEVTL